MQVIHRKWIARDLRKAGLACRSSRSGLSLVVYRPAHWRSGRDERVLGVIPLLDHCVPRRLILGIVEAAGYRVKFGGF